MAAEGTLLAVQARPPSDTRIERASAAESRRRSVAKTVSWRLVATSTTFLIAWIITGDPAAGAAIGGIEGVAKLFLYYGHERVWAQVARRDARSAPAAASL